MRIPSTPSFITQPRLRFRRAVLGVFVSDLRTARQFSVFGHTKDLRAWNALPGIRFLDLQELRARGAVGARLAATASTRRALGTGTTDERGPPSRTVFSGPEAARHANSLRAELRRRGTHPKVLAYCTQEILAKNAFHASLEATKSVFDRLRQLTGEQLDGARLVDAVLMPGATGVPRVVINTGVTATERDEQKGFASLI